MVTHLLAIQRSWWRNHRTLVVVDIDLDGTEELMFGAQDGKVYAWELSGSTVTGWPQDTGSAINGDIVVSNVDDNPDMEVIVANFGGTIQRFESDIHMRSIFMPFVHR